MSKNIKRTITQAVKSQRITPNCRAITFLRLAGSEAAAVDGYPLPDGQALEFNLYPGEIDRTSYDLQFSENALDKMVYIFKEIEL